MTVAPTGKIALKPLLLCQCPKCHEGDIFSGLFSMHPRCPKCDYDFEREPGFYLGAMILSYFVVAGGAVLTVLLLRYFVDDLFPWIIILPLWEVLLLTIPVFRYSRVAWLHIERALTHRFET